MAATVSAKKERVSYVVYCVQVSSVNINLSACSQHFSRQLDNVTSCFRCFSA